MITLIAAALAAAQPAPPADAHAHGAGMPPEQHAAMMAGCPCCPDKGMHDHEGHTSEHSERGAHQQ